MFTHNKLKITIEANMKTVDVLDITMDLRTGVNKHFVKPNNTLVSVHKERNHPPNIIKNIPKSINGHLSTISSTKIAFNKATPTYQKALEKSEYNYKLNYNPPQKAINNKNINNKRSRKRNVTWLNPPYRKLKCFHEHRQKVP